MYCKHKKTLIILASLVVISFTATILVIINRQPEVNIDAADVSSGTQADNPAFQTMLDIYQIREDSGKKWAVLADEMSSDFANCRNGQEYLSFLDEVELLYDETRSKYQELLTHIVAQQNSLLEETGDQTAFDAWDAANLFLVLVNEKNNQDEISLVDDLEKFGSDCGFFDDLEEREGLIPL